LSCNNRRWNKSPREIPRTESERNYKESRKIENVRRVGNRDCGREKAGKRWRWSPNGEGCRIVHERSL
jgi:hypothetical protein